MTETAPEAQPAPEAGSGPKILDAASILLVDSVASVPRVLMGLRQASNVFLPGKWVFPGGRLEAADAGARCAGDLDPGDAHALVQRVLPSTPQKALARALAYAAVRELFEETGHALAQRDGSGELHAPEGRFSHPWVRHGLTPCIAPLRFIARAITPPGRTRRYDTRFFIARRAEVIEHAGTADGEFADLNWFTIEQAQSLDLPNITRRILTDLDVLLKRGQNPHAVPFYYEQDGTDRRDLIARSAAPA